MGFDVELSENQLESDLPEITLVNDMSPVRWSHLLPLLTGYISIDHQDASVISQTVQDKLTSLRLEEISNNKLITLESVTV